MCLMPTLATWEGRLVQNTCRQSERSKGRVDGPWEQKVEQPAVVSRDEPGNAPANCESDPDVS